MVQAILTIYHARGKQKLERAGMFLRPAWIWQEFGWAVSDKWGKKYRYRLRNMLRKNDQKAV